MRLFLDLFYCISIFSLNSSFIYLQMLHCENPDASNKPVKFEYEGLNHKPNYEFSTAKFHFSDINFYMLFICT